jgi:AP-3 complex subunit delta-1
VSSSELEVQERASCALQIVRYVQKQLAKGQASGLGTELAVLFEGELNPVAPKAQRKVQVPEGYVFIIEPISFYCCIHILSRNHK